MKVAFVVQRYGMEIDGGAELHCRYVAEHMRKHVDVEVLTTCALDYVTWKNRFPEGYSAINDVPVRRFRVEKERDPWRYGRKQHQVFAGAHSEKDELEWIRLQGPYAPGLTRYIRKNRDAYDWFVFFSYRYYTAFEGVRAVPDKAILVPTAENDEAIHLSIFKELFNRPRAIVYNSVEERALIGSVAGNQAVPGAVVGTGVHVPEARSPEDFLEKHGLKRPFLLYVGRVDRNKGCLEMFDFHFRFCQETDLGVPLVVIGSRNLEIPRHPELRYLGFLPEEDKNNALAAATLLMMPSRFESLSMVTLEAWAAGIPVLANGECEVLKGQVTRANGGLYYSGYDEFHEALRLLLTRDRLRRILGRQGRAYFERHYTWDIIEAKYLELFGASGAAVP